jgi:hypothetical protein
MMSAVLGLWDLVVACKGTVVVAWRRGSLRTGLVAAVAMLATVGGLWALAGNDGAQDAAAPGGGAETSDPGDADGDAAGRWGAGPADVVDTRSSDAGSGGHRASSGGGGASADGEARDDRVAGRAAGSGSGNPQTTSWSAGPGSGEPDGQTPQSPPGPSTTSPAQSDQPSGGTTTTTRVAPPPDDGSGGSGTGALGGLLGGVLDLLGVQ